MSIEIDISHPGLVLTKFDGEQTPEELERYIARFGEVHRLGRPYVGINFMKRYARNAATTERMGRWLKDTETVTRQLCAGAAIITASPAFRFVLSAVFLIKPMVCPYLVCGGFQEAEKFVREKANLRGVNLMPVLRNPWPDLKA